MRNIRSVRVAQPTPEAIAEAAELIRAGQLVAFPTETVYGLGADAGNGRAVAGIFAAKGRPRFNPLIAHVADVAATRDIATLTGPAGELAAAFWPGPLTLVLPRKGGAAISELVTAGLDTIAVRVPSHPVALQLLAKAGCAIAAPSANRSGHVSTTTAGHVAADLGERVAMILDGGATPHGLESTIVGFDSGQCVLLRHGAVTAEAIAAVIGEHPRQPADMIQQTPSAPGQLESHYAPAAAVRLNARVAGRGEALLAFGRVVAPHDGPLVNLSETGDLIEAAARLFAALRQLDATGTHSIAVMTIPEHDLGAAINDRLRRAAAPRPANPISAESSGRP